MNTAQSTYTSRTDAALQRHTNEIMVTIYNLLYTNDIVSGYLHDAISEFRKTKLCRHEKKMLANRIESKRLSYERSIYDIVKDMAGFLGDSADKFIECSGIEDAISLLYIGIKQKLDDCHVPDSAIIAKMETARALLDVAAQQYEWRMKDLRGVDDALRRIRLEYLSLADADKLMNQLMDSFIFNCTINMNTPRIQQALDKVAKTFADANAIKESITKPN